jgi:hypothetical protein
MTHDEILAVLAQEAIEEAPCSEASGAGEATAFCGLYLAYVLCSG